MVDNSPSGWSYMTSYRPGGSRTILTIQTACIKPIHVTRRRLASRGRDAKSDAYFDRIIQCPPAPRIPFIDLPLDVPDHLLNDVQPAHEIQPQPLFPIDLEQFAGLSSVHTTLLTDHISAFTTIFVCNIQNEVLCEVNTGLAFRGMTTANFVEFLQHLVDRPLTSYTDLSPAVQESVRRHDVQRRLESAWTGSYEPFHGADLLLGNTVLWTLGMDYRGMWVATVDRPRGLFVWS
ncbi:hypothetical protein FB45DRAFT_1043723 [Roridomyces roridus]|uniref:Uncharacterized protein n=1 Tax=Roridomyces roridus TaxID=1738132 RepID=A0AAD7AYM3_9AGAR|nr:hypothetical protein FB45DRAFT_1043723 [Roridomyces roridus]